MIHISNRFLFDLYCMYAVWPRMAEQQVDLFVKRKHKHAYVCFKKLRMRTCALWLFLDAVIRAYIQDWKHVRKRANSFCFWPQFLFYVLIILRSMWTLNGDFQGDCVQEPLADVCRCVFSTNWLWPKAKLFAQHNRKKSAVTLTPPLNYENTTSPGSASEKIGWTVDHSGSQKRPFWSAIKANSEILKII